ncbi:Smr/MutS family protein [Celeribacter indicus]|uniref:Smr protein/MutS2 n=1 Tax=Celeribacter indicus TaxID=1208324 RepID=A0A0B5DNX5_9RHOB|nr:Smr/MutS family protein [Celeribacter indicus]AJE44914.1 Smr protein/MutS2 [Celeribacter indicus]SDW97362.1 DNA-nicking endonuclease, Smr domain [Celeribacter indicus]
MSRRGRKKGLSDEDRDLWDRVRQTARPLRPTRMDPLAVKAPPPEEKGAPNRQPVERFDLEIGKSSPTRSEAHDLVPSLSDRLSAAPLRMDRKQFGKMRKGKLAPEARIDLHGMTLAQAHPALTGFILKSWAMDRRLVLVITGKGKHRDDEGPIPVRKGVLKHQVPHWLHSSPLREAVLQVTEAHLKHGGAGAYYVYLRRRK